MLHVKIQKKHRVYQLLAFSEEAWPSPILKFDFFSNNTVAETVAIFVIVLLDSSWYSAVVAVTVAPLKKRNNEYSEEKIKQTDYKREHATNLLVFRKS